MSALRHTARVALTAAAVSWLASCQGPQVRLATEEPLKVDIAMRVDIYQHPLPQTAPAVAGQGRSATSPESRRRNRMAEIQELKNSRLVGEGRDGLLVLLQKPPGDYGNYVSKLVEEENADRMEIMRQIAQDTKKPLPEIQRTQAEEWRQRSFSGEWIEVPLPDGTGYQWQQKPGS